MRIFFALLPFAAGVAWLVLEFIDLWRATK